MIEKLNTVERRTRILEFLRLHKHATRKELSEMFGVCINTIVNDLYAIMIHSDQGWHYTNPQFHIKVLEMGLQQSMSRRGNCWDNAPQESFFGHLKDEVDIKSCDTFDEVCELITDYIDYYNNDRYQWNLNRMTPIQYRNSLLNV